MEDEGIKKSESEAKKDTSSKQSVITKFKKLDAKKKIQYAVILLITVVILAIFFASSNEPANTTDDAQSTYNNVQNESLEDRLMKTLSKIEGAGAVEVMITYETSAMINPAISVDTQISTTTDVDENGDRTTNTQNTQSEIVTIAGSNGNEALVLSENSPVIKGVLVVAQGADDITVMLNLLKAVQTVLNVDANQVDVYKMNKE